MTFDDRCCKVFFVDGPKQYRLKCTFKDGVPFVGMSQFYERCGNWFPGKKHFYMPYPAWQSLLQCIMDFKEQVEKGEI